MLEPANVAGGPATVKRQRRAHAVDAPDAGLRGLRRVLARGQRRRGHRPRVAGARGHQRLHGSPGRDGARVDPDRDVAEPGRGARERRRGRVDCRSHGGTRDGHGRPDGSQAGGAVASVRRREREIVDEDRAVDRAVAVIEEREVERVRRAGGHGDVRVQQRGGGAVGRAGRLGGRHGREARRLDRQRLAVRKRSEVARRRDRRARRRPGRRIHLGDEGVVEGARQPRGVFLREEAQVERDARRLRPGGAHERDLQHRHVAGRRGDPRQSALGEPGAAVVAVREDARPIGGVGLCRVAGRHHDEARVVEGNGTRALAASPVPTGLPVGRERDDLALAGEEGRNGLRAGDELPRVAPRAG